MSNVNHVKNCKYIKNGKSTVIGVKEFKLDQIRRESEQSKEPSILIFAKRNSGKSWLCRALVYHFRDIPCGTIISLTEEYAPFYSKFVPDAYIHYEYKPKYLTKLFERQEIMINKRAEYAKIGKHIDARIFLLMDDCLADKKKWEADQNISRLLLNGRHFHIMFLLTLQEVLGINPKLRQNFDYIFVFRNSFVNEQKKIYEHYAGMFKTLDLFKKTFTKLTENYGIMVLINKGGTSSINDQVMHYKALDIGNEPVGCKQFNENHRLNYDADWKKHKRVVMNLEDLDKKNINDVDIEKEGDE